MATDEAQPAAALAKTLDGLDLDGAAGAKGKKKTSSVAAFGTRVLQSPDEVWDHNAWDNAEWNDDDEAEAAKAVAKQRLNPVPAEQRDKYDREAAGFWDAFYAKNENRFFKDRHWLDLEFPELFNGIASGDAVDAPRINILEIGCGAGNTAFPLIAATPSNVFVYACDFSSTAIDVVRSSKEYDEKRCSAFVYDITSPNPPPEVPPGSLDYITAIFVLSAVPPSTWATVAANLASLLKPNGLLLFRDYGRYDLTQLRLKGGRLLDDNFYIRGDGTRVYFFAQDEVPRVFGERFEVLSNDVDRRLLVNRKRRVRMQRVWVQAKLRLKADGDLGGNEGEAKEEQTDRKNVENGSDER